MADARREFHDKLSGLSRDIAIKQAELEQANVKDAITQGLVQEGQLMDQAMQLDRLSFEAVKATADHGIATHNAALERFKALQNCRSRWPRWMPQPSRRPFWWTATR